jgi:hypothetical protein
MTKRLLLAVGVVLATAPASLAQDGLRSASLPERPVATQPPGPTDLFRAKPDTYQPHPDRPLTVPTPVIGGVYWPYVDTFQPVTRERLTAPRDERVVRIEIVTPPPTRTEPAPAVAPPVPRPPVVKKTLYVIPRCYAGDTPPGPDTHCDLTKLRTIR